MQNVEQSEKTKSLQSVIIIKNCNPTKPHLILKSRKTGKVFKIIPKRNNTNLLQSKTNSLIISTLKNVPCSEPSIAKENEVLLVPRNDSNPHLFQDEVSLEPRNDSNLRFRDEVSLEPRNDSNLRFQDVHNLALNEQNHLQLETAGETNKLSNFISKPDLGINLLLLNERNIATKNKTISDPFAILNQSKFDPKESKFFCDECRKEFISLKQFYLHRRHHAIKSSQSYKKRNNKFNYCPLCLDLIVVSKNGLIEKQNKKLFNYLYCKLCGITPKSVNNLKIHYELEHQQLNPFCYIFSEHSKFIGNYYCKICLKNFQNLKTLIAHKRTHLEIEKVKECNMCNEVFKTNYDLSFHRYTHIGEELFKCHKCNYIFFSLKFLQEHLDSKHPKIDTSCICEYCGVKFCSTGGLGLHKKTHNKSNILSRDLYSCDTCDMKFSNFHQLQDHKINTIHKTDDIFKCEKCLKIFCYQKLYDEHMFTHDPTMKNCIRCNERIEGDYFKHFDTKHQCKYCPETLNNQTELKSHQNAHLLSPLSCKYCDKKFNDYAKYLDHYKFHRYMCLLCRKRFRNSSTIMFHEFVFHAKTKKYPCTKCSIRFYESEQLEEHLDKAHYSIENTLKQIKIEKIPGIKLLPVYMNIIDLPDHNLLEDNCLPYGCKYCELKFSNLKNLKIHLINVHIIPFETICKICNVNFHLNTYLKMHVHETVAKIKKRYKCDICNEMFKTPTHNEDHPLITYYFCEYCNKLYFKLGYIIKHYKHVHNINNFIA